MKRAIATAVAATLAAAPEFASAAARCEVWKESEIRCVGVQRASVRVTNKAGFPEVRATVDHWTSVCDQAGRRDSSKSFVFKTGPGTRIPIPSGSALHCTELFIRGCHLPGPGNKPIKCRFGLDVRPD